MCAERMIEEAARSTPVVGEYDVLVVGGGIAGVAAAVAAARNGARACLVERYCGLGGLATAGNVTIWLPLCDGMGTQVVGGLGEDLLRLSVADLPRDYDAARFRRVPECWQPGGDSAERATRRYLAEFNPSSYLLALEKLVVDAGVAVMYDTRFCAVRREGGCVSHAIVENKDGRVALAGRVVIDATGDADVCFAAGEKTASLDTNVLCGWFYTLTDGELRLHQYSRPYSPDAGRGGAEGPFFRGDSAEQVTQHILQTREGIRGLLAELREARGEGDVQLIMPATTACFRMTRRLVGRASIAAADAHRWREDVVGLSGDWRKAGPVWAIPLGSLRAVGTANLLAAGRCISVENSAWDALRAIPPCVVTGEAAGTAAALAAAQAAGDIDAVGYDALRTRLLAQGVLLDRTLLAEDRAGA